MQFLFFDLGNVLLSFSHERMCEQMAAVAHVDVAAVQRVLLGDPHATGPDSLQWRLERGEINVNEAFEEFCQTLGVRPERAALYQAGSDIFAPIPGSVALVQRLAAAGNRLGVLSNTNPLDWEFVTTRYAFLQRDFETAVLSFEVRAMKPERAIFDEAIARAGVAADEIFFVDDRPEHVRGARDAGIDAVQFTTTEELEAELVRRNVAGAARPELPA